VPLSISLARWVPLLGFSFRKAESSKVFRMAGKTSHVTGNFLITWMEQWDDDYLNMEVPAFIRLDPPDKHGAQSGEFQFGPVRGWLDCRTVSKDGKPAVEFSWEGEDEGDLVTGRGWAALDDDGSLKGRIFIHGGDDSGFVASPGIAIPLGPTLRRGGRRKIRR
jgi:hypothetical protein